MRSEVKLNDGCHERGKYDMATYHLNYISNIECPTLCATDTLFYIMSHHKAPFTY
jgi:hypothetical protein